MQLDFTHGTMLEVTILGVAFAHLLCHVVLPYSNWQHVTVCLSESFLALKRGLQAALFELGRVPEWVQTDNSTAATHELADGRRGFNGDYEDLVKHLGMKARTIGVGKKELNGDIEAAHRPLKRRIQQQLLLRGSRDFESVEAYEKWVSATIVKPANRGRAKRFDEERALMSPMRATRLPEFVERDVRVTSWSTVRVDRRTYSVPSRLIGEKLRVRLYENYLDFYYASEWQFRFARLRGQEARRIDYRHVIPRVLQRVPGEPGDRLAGSRGDQPGWGAAAAAGPQELCPRAAQRLRAGGRGAPEGFLGPAGKPTPWRDRAPVGRAPSRPC